MVKNNFNFLKPNTRKNEVINWIDKGLKDFSISRLSVDWGIKVPEDPKHTIYVWFDALIGIKFKFKIKSNFIIKGYLTGTITDNKNIDISDIENYGWPAETQLLGQDILRFHAVNFLFFKKRD